MDHTAVNARVQASLPALERVHFRVELGALGVMWLLTETAGFPSVWSTALQALRVHLSPAPSSGKGVGVGCLSLCAKLLDLAEVGQQLTAGCQAAGRDSVSDLC